VQAEPEDMAISLHAIMRLSPSTKPKEMLVNVGQSALGVAVDLGHIQRGGDLLLEPLAELEQAIALGVHLLAGDLAGLAQADDAGDIERAGAEATLLAAAVDER
jgi:hypothetical protein